MMFCATNQETWPSASNFGTVCVALIDDILLRQSPESVIIPVDETLFQKPGILIRPDHFLALSGAVPKSEHANIESVNKL